MTTQRQIRVTMRKQVSDGAYGTEAAEVTLETWCDSDEEEDVATHALLMAARRYVHAELARSPSPKVRASVQMAQARQPVAVASPPRWVDVGDDDDGAQ